MATKDASPKSEPEPIVEPVVVIVDELDDEQIDWGEVGAVPVDDLDEPEVVEVEVEAVVAETDPIGTLRLGDQDGLAALVNRSLGLGDSATYDLRAQAFVTALQESNDGDYELGVVSGETWGLILRPLREGDSGHEVLIARHLLGEEQVAQQGTLFDADVAGAVLKFQEDLGIEDEDGIGRATWMNLVGLAGL